MAIEEINAFTKVPFADEGALLKFYRECLPRRVGSYRLDEVGPIMSAGTPEEVEGYLNHRFSFNGVCVDMKGKLDWYAAPEGDLEWNGGLVRQGHLMYLANAYRDTGDERWAAAVVEQMLDYIRSVPPFQPEGKPYLEYKKSTWRPFEVAGRAAENWPVALAEIIGSASMTSAAFAEIYRSIHQHARFLEKYHWHTGNHACLEVAGLGVISILYREFAEADSWRAECVRFLTDMLDQQFHGDGYTREMSGAYHWVAMRNFLAFLQVARRSGMGDIFPEKYIRTLTQAAQAEFYQQKPDFSLPVTNDSNVTTCHRKQLLQLEEFLGKETLEYRLSGGSSGKKPEHTSLFFPQAQLGVMRSDWTPGAAYGFLDMGPWGTNHMNEDQLNFELSAYGRNLLVNCGRWRYTTSPGVDWVDQAQYFKTTAAYNSVLVDGMCQMPGDAEGTMTVSDRFDWARGIFSSGYGEAVSSRDEELLKTKGVTAGKICRIPDAKHRREILFAKPCFFLVRDTVFTPEQRTVSQLWHTAGGSVKRYGNAVWSCFEDANFLMLQLGEPSFKVWTGSREPFRGWNCPRYNQLVPAPELEFTKTGKGAVTFETLICPVRGPVNEKGLPVFRREAGGPAAVYTVVWQGQKYTVTAGDGAWNLESGEQ